MKKITFIISLTVFSCNLDSYLYPSINMTDFPNNIEPFNNKAELMIQCENDPLCGTYKYLSGNTEKALLRCLGIKMYIIFTTLEMIKQNILELE